MKKFMGLMEKYLMPLAMKMASNRHLNALKRWVCLYDALLNNRFFRTTIS